MTEIYMPTLAIEVEDVSAERPGTPRPIKVKVKVKVQDNLLGLGDPVRNEIGNEIDRLMR